MKVVSPNTKEYDKILNIYYKLNLNNFDQWIKSFNGQIRYCSYIEKYGSYYDFAEVVFQDENDYTIFLLEHL